MNILIYQYLLMRRKLRGGEEKEGKEENEGTN